MLITMKTSGSCNRFDTSMILMYIGLGITIATDVPKIP